jgi:signal peptidase I
MENTNVGLSNWFYLGLCGIILGLYLIYNAKNQLKSKSMENGYFILILGLVGVISEWEDFATVLFFLVVASGIIILLDKTYFARKRVNSLPRQHFIHYSYEFFPILFAVFVLRAFLFEAYQIPSSSMRPDLTVGDFILVNKYTLGIREPVTNKVLINVNPVKRGDVIVFKDPNVRNRDLIKRVVGVGGDKIEYYNKRLTINGQPLEYQDDGTYTYTENYPNQGDILISNQQYIENLTGVKHKIITWNAVPPLFGAEVQNFKDKQNCQYSGDDGFTCVVPQGKYFMMGDNRDNSLDSRYWGFVSNNAILGKAVLVWFNFHDLKRIGVKI